MFLDSHKKESHFLLRDYNIELSFHIWEKNCVFFLQFLNYIKLQSFSSIFINFDFPPETPNTTKKNNVQERNIIKVIEAFATR